MDDTNNPEQPEQPKSAWDNLADKIGATPSSDALERKRRAIENQYEPVQRPKSAPTARGSDWTALAGELGVELPEPAPSAPPPTKPVEAAAKEAPTEKEMPTVKDDAKKPPRRSRGKSDKDKARRAPEKHEKRDRGNVEKEVEVDSEDSLFADLPTIDGEDWTTDAPELDVDAPEDVTEAGNLPPTESRDDAPVSETQAGLSETTDEVDDSGAPTTGEDDDEVSSSSLSGDAARSAFDALFESGSFASMEVPLPDAPVGKTRDEVDAPDPSVAGSDKAGSEGAPPNRGGWFGFGRRRQKNSAETTKKVDPTPTEETTDEPEDWLGKSATDSAEMAPAEPEADDAGEDESSKAKTTGRRRRRRRRRRPAAKEDQAKSDTIENGRPGDAIKRDALDSDEDDDEIIEDEEDSDDDAIDGDVSPSDEGGGSRRRPVHKNIPTWSDAIGVMVDANLQSRKQSRDRPSARGGSGKGRGRGVRRRKKS